MGIKYLTLHPNNKKIKTDQLKFIDLKITKIIKVRTEKKLGKLQEITF